MSSTSVEEDGGEVRTAPSPKRGVHFLPVGGWYPREKGVRFHNYTEALILLLVFL